MPLHRLSKKKKKSGAPFRAIAIAPAGSITINGTPKEYIKISDSGNKRIQAFCENCGTQLFATDLERKLFNLRAGFLEQRDILEPKEHVFTNSSFAVDKYVIKIKSNVTNFFIKF